MKKPWNLQVFPLSNVWWVDSDIHSTLTSVFFFAPDVWRKDKEKWIGSMRNDSATHSGSHFQYTQFHTKHNPYLVDRRYCYTEALKIPHACQTCLCLSLGDDKNVVKKGEGSPFSFLQYDADEYGYKCPYWLWPHPSNSVQKRLNVQNAAPKIK